MNVQVPKSASRTERKDDRKLSMRAVREARNDIELTLSNVKSHRDGLITMDAMERLMMDGPNEVAHDKRPHALLQFLTAFKNPFIMVLVALASISALTDIWLPLQAGEDPDPTKVIIILVMVLASGLMRFIQE